MLLLQSIKRHYWQLIRMENNCKKSRDNVPLDTSMTLEQCFIYLNKRFQEVGIDTAGLDARLLMAHVYGLTQEDLILRNRVMVSQEALKMIDALAEKRVMGCPVARLVGRREFYGLHFALNNATLDPRPDTECLIEHAIDIFAGRRPGHLLDLGTGSGVLITTLLRHFPSAYGVATDIHIKALEIARENIIMNGVSDRCIFVCTSWLDSLSSYEIGSTGCRKGYDLIISNPPYIETGNIANLDIAVRDYDPFDALNGGEDGLAAYRNIATGVKNALAPNGICIVEIGAGQMVPVRGIFTQCGLVFISAQCDLGGLPRSLAFARL